MDEGVGVSEDREKGPAALRLCNLVAQGPGDAKEEFKQEVEKELAGWETEPWEIIYSMLYKSQLPVVEQVIETAALMLGTDKSRGYCLEMICADFLAGANLENENSEILLQSALRFFKFLPGEERQTFLHHVTEKASCLGSDRNVHASCSNPSCTNCYTIKCYVATVGDANCVAQCPILRFANKNFAVTLTMIRSRT
jgi:hypothetical protein